VVPVMSGQFRFGKGKAHKPYEFGVKVSVATPVKHSAGGQFVAHIAALPGNPYDGHTLANVVPAMQALLGNVLDRIIADAGYRGHNAPADHKFRVYTAGQKRRVKPQIKREFKRRAAIEPVIGHLKDDHRMGRRHTNRCRRYAVRCRREHAWSLPGRRRDGPFGT
jgi:IS5 family transposase